MLHRTHPRKTAFLGPLLVMAMALTGMAQAATPNIAKVQQLLSEMAYSPGEADGLMGPATRDAIELFQRDYGLPETGQADRATLAKLTARHQRMIKLRKQTIEPSDYAFFDKQNGDSKPAKKKPASNKPPAKIAAPAIKKPSAPAEPERTFSLLAITQEQLDELGYDPGAYDGDMTPGTREALVEFQEANGLELTGKPDQATNNMLNKRMLELKRRQTGTANRPQI